MVVLKNISDSEVSFRSGRVGGSSSQPIDRSQASRGKQGHKSTVGRQDLYAMAVTSSFGPSRLAFVLHSMPKNDHPATVKCLDALKGMKDSSLWSFYQVSSASLSSYGYNHGDQLGSVLKPGLLYVLAYNKPIEQLVASDLLPVAELESVKIWFHSGWVTKQTMAYWLDVLGSSSSSNGTIQQALGVRLSSSVFNVYLSRLLALNSAQSKTQSKIQSDDSVKN